MNGAPSTVMSGARSTLRRPTDHSPVALGQGALALTESALRQLLDTVSPTGAGSSDAEVLTAVLGRLAELVACAGIGFIELDRHRHTLRATQFISSAPVRVAPIDTRGLVVHPFRARDDGATLVAGYLRTIGFRHELMAPLADRTGVACWLVLARLHGEARFSERDRLLLTLLQPHVAAVLDRVGARGRSAPELTARQVQLLRRVARGETNRQIARHLGLAESTVRTHLEHIYARLEVHSRTEALAVAAPLLNG